MTKKCGCDIEQSDYVYNLELELEHLRSERDRLAGMIFELQAREENNND